MTVRSSVDGKLPLTINASESVKTYTGTATKTSGKSNVCTIYAITNKSTTHFTYDQISSNGPVTISGDKITFNGDAASDPSGGYISMRLRMNSGSETAYCRLVVNFA